MKKKLALIVISLDECFTQKGFSGGGHKVTKHLIAGLIESGIFEIDIYCKKSALTALDGMNSITVLDKKTFVKDLSAKIAQNSYDYVLSSDVLLPFGNQILHSNSAKYKSKNGKSPLAEKILTIYNSNKINKQQKCFAKNDKHIFTVSDSLKNDYVQSYGIDEDRVFVSYPAVDAVVQMPPAEQKTFFTIGSMAGGGLNKGGYLLLFALKKFVNENNIVADKFKARIIFPKFHKSGFFKLLINFLGLTDYIELLPKQSNMQEFYHSIDCYVLPSLNEAFGLVVTEAGSCSRPSLVSSTTGVRELVVDGENGFVFDRAQNPVNNLSDGLRTVFNLYFADYQKYQEVAQGAFELSKSLYWQEFTGTIIKNMKEEKRD